MVSEKYDIAGVSSYTAYDTGELKDCKVTEYNEIKVKDNILVPRYRELDERKRDTKALSFYKSGNLRSISLEEQTEILTPIGRFPAEFLTFFEDGEIDSLFPLNGQIGFGWSIEDEEKLQTDFKFNLAPKSAANKAMNAECKNINFKLSSGEFEAKIIGLRFYNSRKLKSIILWPKEIIHIQTPIGNQAVRIGFRLYEDGNLESFEPAKPVTIKTPIGDIVAFDQNAIGMDADYNSVSFHPNGDLCSISTNSDIVVNNSVTGQRNLIYQQMRFEMTSDKMMKIPVKISFQDNTVTIDNGAEALSFPMKESKFMFMHDGYYMEKKCSPGSDCSGCGSECL
jgi:hypothetical protein